MRFSLNFVSNLYAFLQGRDRIAGLVVEQERVRFAEFRTAAKSTTGRRRILVEEGAVRLPANTIRGGMLVQPKALGEAIHELRTKATPHSLSAPNIIASVPLAHLVGRTIALPLSVHVDEVESTLRLEMEHALPFPIDEAYFDWQVIPHASTTPTLTQNFLVVAARRNEVDPYLQALQDVGLNTVALEPLTMSIVRGLEQRSGVTYIALVYPETLLAAGMDEQGRARLFHHRSIPKLPEGPSAVPEGKDRADALTVELTSFIRFFRAEVGGKEQELIADGFFGDISLKALQGLSQSLTIPVHIEQDSHVLSRAAARGAALRGMMSRSEDRLASLMPVGTEEVYATKRREFFAKLAMRILIGASVISAVLLASAAGYLRAVEQNAQSQVKSQAPIPAETLQQVDRINTDINQALTVVNLPKTPEGIPKALMETAPPGITVLEMIFDTQQSGSTHVQLTVLSSGLSALLAERDILQKSFAVEVLAIPKELFLRPNEPVQHAFIFFLKSGVE